MKPLRSLNNGKESTETDWEENDRYHERRNK